MFEWTLQSEMHAHPIRIQCQQPFRTVSNKVPKRRTIVLISIAITRIMLKIESKMSDQDAIPTSPYAENNTLDQQPAVRCNSLQYLTSAIKCWAKTAKPKHSKRKRRYSTSSSSSSSSSSVDDEPPKR